METLTGERPTAPSVAESPAAPAARSTPMALLVAMRPPEWIKNLLVFAGLLFSGKLDEGAQVLDATLTFAAFCAISSAGYLFNDLHDAPFDRQHPEKRHRPIASGALPASVAWPAAVALAAIGLGVALARGLGRGRRVRGPVRRHHRRLLPGDQAPGDPRRDDDRLAVHPSRGRRRGRGRGPRLGVADSLHGDAGPVPRLHQAAPGGDVGSIDAHRLLVRQRAAAAVDPAQPDPRREVAGDPAGARALLAAVPRPDGRHGHRRGDHQLRDLRGQQPPDRQPHARHRCPRSSTGSSATST